MNSGHQIAGTKSEESTGQNIDKEQRKTGMPRQYTLRNNSPLEKNLKE